ncbi:hypothetical protein [Bradyrhizobium sp.]|uniref:hypothetical protein n=1 Tax=Bradyrhizobium sp. TaxID=376 RepID=UPI0040378BDD
MTSEAHSTKRPSISWLAHIIDRSGLAIVGALCGLFVTALLAKANADLLSSVDLAPVMMLYGAVGFYMRIDSPGRPSGTLWIDLLNVGFGRYTDLAELLSAVGMLLAAAAALVSVYSVVVDEVVPAIWMVAVGASWLVGIALQITAGVIGHIRV